MPKSVAPVKWPQELREAQYALNSHIIRNSGRETDESRAERAKIEARLSELKKKYNIR